MHFLNFFSNAECLSFCETRRAEHRIELPHNNPKPKCLAITCERNPLVIVGCERGKILIWNPIVNLITSLYHIADDHIISLAASPYNHNQFLAGLHNGNILLLNVHNGEVKFSCAYPVFLRLFDLTLF